MGLRLRRRDRKDETYRNGNRLLTMAAGIWHSWTTGVTSKRSLTAFDPLVSIWAAE